MLSPKKSRKFTKEYVLMEKRNKNMMKIDEVVALIIKEIPLPPRYHNHPLHGKYEGSLECHIEPDWLLIYKIYPAVQKVVFLRTGSHSDLF
ncbi:MAG: type II toxin-antitoxin system YafQ family toxin [Spirochaetaceae bacterium]|jgi:mRNA interferase YafQ|nr:type II toxin-antitoxin system YafQ family toxin [Spirochaetaceae bacterium]